MKRIFAGCLAGVILSTTSALSQEAKDNEFCVDYFGVGEAVGETCRPFSGPKRKIAASELTAALSDGVVDIRIVSEDTPEEAFDLTPLSASTGVHSLDLFRVGSVDLTPLHDMKGLYSLSLAADAAGALSQLTGEFPELMNLRIHAPRQTIDLSVLSNMPELRVISVNADAITGQESLSGLVKLERANFKLMEATDFSSLASLGQLEWLDIVGALGRTVLDDAEFVTALHSLTVLDLGANTLEDLRPLAGLSNLKTLILSDNKTLSDIGPIAGLPKLRNLQLRNTQVSDLSPLTQMDELELLWLRRTPVSDLSALAGLSNLWALELAHTQVTDLTPLSQLSLQHLNVKGTEVTDFSAVHSETKIRK